MGSGVDPVSRKTSFSLAVGENHTGEAFLVLKSNSNAVVAEVVMPVAVRMPGPRSPSGEIVPVPVTAPIVPEPSSLPWSRATFTPA